MYSPAWQGRDISTMRRIPPENVRLQFYLAAMATKRSGPLIGVARSRDHDTGALSCAGSHVFSWAFAILF
jgi:hypothetical protein